MALTNPNAPQPPSTPQIAYVTFWVPGKPIGQGRVSTINGRSFHSNGGTLNPWRHNIGYTARQARLPLIGAGVPVKLRLNFYFERGKSVTREYPTISPDLDHLVRAVGDALTGIAYVDDAQIVAFDVAEFYGQQGVEISVGALL